MIHLTGFVKFRPNVGPTATVFLMAVVACGGDTPTTVTEPLYPDLPKWQFAEEPTLEIGVVEGDDDYQLFRAVSAARLSDQTIIVANTGTAQLRFFDHDGRFLRSVGRWGNGPGEFRWLQGVQVAEGDTVVAFDGRLRRSFFAPDGEFVRSDNIPYQRETDFPSSVWLYQNAWVDGVNPGDERIAVARAIDRLPPPGGAAPFWYVRVDREGSLWVSDGIETNGLRRHWTIHDTNGVAVARASLPESFEMLEMARTDVLGRWRDGFDVEFIRIYELDRSATRADGEPPPRSAPADASLELGVEGDPMRDLRAMVRDIATAQERYFSDHVRYATHPSQLDWDSPEGTWFSFVKMTRSGYWTVAGHVGAPRICGIVIGETPPGWIEGAAKCAQLEPR